MTANKTFMKQFYASKKGTPTVMSVGGAFQLKDLPKKTRDKILTRLKAKDKRIKTLTDKGAVGVKIDGQYMTQDWADQLNLEKPEIERTDGNIVTSKPKETESVKPDVELIGKMTKVELDDFGKEHGVDLDRRKSKSSMIQTLLKALGLN